MQEARRNLPRFQNRPLASIAAGQALADLQRSAIRRDIRLPPSFALVGKTLVWFAGLVPSRAGRLRVLARWFAAS